MGRDGTQWKGPANKPRPIVELRDTIGPTTTWGYGEALEIIAINKTIILAMLDDSQELSVRNFYENSIVPLGLSNTLFVSTSSGGCQAPLALHIPRVVYGNSPDGAVSYDTRKFLAKMNVRTNYTLLLPGLSSWATQYCKQTLMSYT